MEFEDWGLAYFPKDTPSEHQTVWSAFDATTKYFDPSKKGFMFNHRGLIVMDRQEREAKIELYGRGYDMLIETLKDVPQEMWKFKPEPKEWSVHEVLVHLADSESNAALRARKLIVEPGGMLMGYEQDKWTIELDYHDQSYEDALEVVRLVRKTTYKLLKKQPDEVFTHTARHPEYDEPYTFEQWLNIYSAHIPGHIEQIRNNYKIWRDQQG